jgi:hypothetical protein
VTVKLDESYTQKRASKGTPSHGWRDVLLILVFSNNQHLFPVLFQSFKKISTNFTWGPNKLTQITQKYSLDSQAQCEGAEKFSKGSSTLVQTVTRMAWRR